MTNINILDFHTHRQDAQDALISVDPREFKPQPGLWYSVGFHPWIEADELGQDEFDILERHASHPQVLAIGETGMDNRRGGNLEAQAAVFVRHLRLAATVGKPVVVHSVKTAQQILAERKKAGLDAVPLVIHGMRANANVARVLLQAGCYLSFGMNFNSEALLITPLDRLLIETDEGPNAIADVASRVAATLGITVEELTRQVPANVSRLLADHRTHQQPS